MRVLVVAAHPDDEVLGCGGTIARHVLAGDRVAILMMGAGRGDPSEAPPAFAAASAALGLSGVIRQCESGLRLRDQRFDATERLDIVKAVEDALRSERPEIVYTHHIGDRNLDHRIVADAVFTACRPLPGSSVKRLLSFEVPGSTEWGDGFVPNVFVGIDGAPWERKVRALECYSSEMRFAPHPRSLAGISQQMMVRGSAAGVLAAEAFMLVREIR